MFLRRKIVLGIVMSLVTAIAARAHEGKSIVDQYADDPSYEYFPDYPGAPWYRYHGRAIHHPIHAEPSRDHRLMPQVDYSGERYRR
jgi:hypothetical protein